MKEMVMTRGVLSYLLLQFHILTYICSKLIHIGLKTYKVLGKETKIMSNWYKIGMVILAGIAIFILDISIELGVAGGVPYVLFVLLGLVFKDKRTPLYLGFVGVILTLLGYYLSSSGGEEWKVFLNRLYAILSISIVAYALYVVMKNQNQIKELNNQLKQFVYIASHDLQEPLVTINSFVELLQEEYKGKLDENADIYLDFISKSTIRMKALIKALLDYSIIGNEKKKIIIDFNKLLEEIQDDLSEIIKDSNTTIHVDELPQINGYRVELRLLFQNLITNAIKFQKNDNPPKIKISALKERNAWVFSVEDNGIGISSADKEKIFQVFKRLHNDSEYEGTGIGLAHCLKIATMHNGSIWVDSQPNKGSTFHILIPKL